MVTIHVYTYMHDIIIYIYIYIYTDEQMYCSFMHAYQQL